MKKKIIILSSVIIVMIMGILYINYNNLIAGDRDGKSCTSSSGCTSKSHNDVKADNNVNSGNEFATYEFVTDKAYSDEMKNILQTNLLSVTGVKDIKFGMSCSVSKMTHVSVMYAAGETNEAALASFIKEKNLDCSKHEGCGPNGTCPQKNTKETKKI